MAACKAEIAEATPKLEGYPGWQRLIGNLALAVFTAGIGYALAAYVNHKYTGNYTFFHSNAVNLAGSCIASIPDEYQEREAAINAMDIIRLGYQVKKARIMNFTLAIISLCRGSFSAFKAMNEML